MPSGQGAPPQTAAAQTLVGRTPIGEAVVISRAPGPPNVPVRATAGSALPDAPSIVPARQPEAPAPRPLTPEQAVADAVRIAAPKQSGTAPLFANVEQAASHDAVPPPVRQAGAAVLALRVPLNENIAASDVKQAFVRSGVLFEPRLAAARAMSVTDADIAMPAPASDLKAALVVFRQVLKAWSANEPAPSRPDVSGPALSRPAANSPPVGANTTEPPVRVPLPANDPIRNIANALAGLSEEPMPQGAPLSAEQATTLAKTLSSVLEARATLPSQSTSPGALPPPYRGEPPAAQGVAAPSIAIDAAPREVADKLIAQTDGALARQTLLQVASLPDRPDLPRAEAGQRWNFEIPFATPQGTAIAQFEVSRDARAAKSDPETRTWRARFSLDVEPMGPVHASITLNGARTSVTLWAERHATAARLNDNAAMLSEALRAAELEPADFQLRVGAPPAARQAALGRFMDRAT